jgi:sortase A
MIIAHGYAVTHFAYSAAIGSGNAVLYGHDDIEGGVFGRLQELRPGDEVDVTSSLGLTVSYRVTGRSIVQPNAVQILAPTSDVRLTLFTCWPTWVDTQRVVITAQPAA